MIGGLYRPSKVAGRRLVKISKRAGLIAVFAAIWSLARFAGSAEAQLANLYPAFLQVENPGYLQATLFGGGFASGH
jgi:hypothetical protein